VFTLTGLAQEKEQKDILRTIFLNILIVGFITISYVYISEPFGSISTIFITNQEFSIQFGITLLVFTFFAILGGPIQGLISGFLGELLYQLAFYNSFYIEWCLFVAILGFLTGIYKYHPLKYHDGIKVYYTFIILIITLFILFGLIVIFQLFFYPNQNTVEEIVINYGFKFFLQALISTIFFIPILLVIYDKILAKEEKELYYTILTHHPPSAIDHTFYLKFGRTKIYFCTRCSGVILGGLSAMFTTYLTAKILQVEFSAEIALLMCILLPIPGLADWGTQRLLLRKSNTASRLLTGFIIGLALHFMSFTYKYYFYTLLILIIYFSIFFLLVFLGRRKEMRLWKEKYEDISEI